MIPSTLSAEVTDALRDFLATAFGPSNAPLSSVMDDFLGSEENLVKGPYLSLDLPFETVAEGGEPFPEVPLGFTPYRHQRTAFNRIRAGESTVIATGTGSGKTECFLYPLLDHCRVHADHPGVKAILIYPMNALASDQARRIARIVNGTPSLQGKVTAGLYVGEKGASPRDRMTAGHLIENREALRKHPPDILLTNYKMLDLLLTRPIDAPLWRHNAPGTLRYLVVDELHTFDGAQGTDLACLVRRLRARLGADEKLICVGTSATIGGEEDRDSILDYVSAIFRQPFASNAIVVEARQRIDEFLGEAIISAYLAPRPDLGEVVDPGRYRSVEDFIRAQYALFLGEALQGTFEALEWRLDLGRRLPEHAAFVNLLRVLDRAEPVSLEVVVERLRRSLPVSSVGEARHVLNALCALISVARARDDAQPNAPAVPLLSVKTHVWVRELRRMVCSVWEVAEGDSGVVDEPLPVATDDAQEAPADEPTEDTDQRDGPVTQQREDQSEQPQRRLRYSDDLKSDEESVHLPLIQCRECHVTGWGCVKHGGESRIGPDGFTDRLAGVDQAFRKRVVIREEPGVLMAKRNHDCPGERRKVDNVARAVVLLAVPEHVPEDQPALGVRIDDLDRLSGHCRDHIARALGRSRRHVLDQPDEPHRVHPGLASGERFHHPDYHRGAGHVPFHLLHAVARLYGDTAGIERHSLSDERDGGPLSGFGRPLPPEHDESRLARAALGNSEQGAHAERGHFRLVENLDGESLLSERRHTFGEAFGKEHVGGLGDQVAGEEDALGDRGQRRKCVTRRPMPSGCDRDRGEARLVLRLLLRSVTVETVAPEHRPEAQVCSKLGRNLGPEGNRRGLVAGLRQGGDGGAPGGLHLLGAELVRLAEPLNEDPACGEPRRREQDQVLVELAGEPAFGDGPGKRTPARLVRLKGGAVKPPTLEYADDECSASRPPRGRKRDLHTGIAPGHWKPLAALADAWTSGGGPYRIPRRGAETRNFFWHSWSPPCRRFVAHQPENGRPSSAPRGKQPMSTHQALPEIDLHSLETLARDPRVRRLIAAVGPVSRPPPAEMRICGCAYLPSEPRPATKEPDAPKPPKNDKEPGMGTGFVYGTVFGVVLTIAAFWLLG